ncbi:MAG: iron uptake protein [Pseudomonadota bacterium]
MPSHLNTIMQSRTYRIILAVFGGYIFTAGFFAGLSVFLALMGTARIEALYWSILMSFLVFTSVVIGAVATTRPLLLSVILVVGASVMIGGAPLLTSRLGPA